MSTNEVTLFFESFLKKRKDTMRMRWATYWLILQNTTLLYYTKKEINAPHLRGVYSIYTVQSVREVRRDEANRFMFELIMTNGKKKLLAADTAALRAQWQAHLQQAMHLCTSPGLCTQASSPCGDTAPNTVRWDAPFPSFKNTSSPTSEKQTTVENLYDVPGFHRRAGESELNGEVKDVIYDVPSSLLRTKTVQTVGEQNVFSI